jgi:predicted nucleotidyltransferase
MRGQQSVDRGQAFSTDAVLGLYRKLVLQRFGQDVDRVVLFGSRARLEDHEDSDWDVAVFLNRPITAADQRGVSEIGHDVIVRRAP